MTMEISTSRLLPFTTTRPSWPGSILYASRKGPNGTYMLMAMPATTACRA